MKIAAATESLAPKILIIERQMIIAADASLQLSKLGYKVIGINTRFEDAMITLENNRPDIVLMNVDIQGRAAGLRTARTMMDSFHIPLVFLSANTDKETFEEIIDTLPYAFISKPFDKNDLQRGIEMALDRMVAEGLWPRK